MPSIPGIVSEVRADNVIVNVVDLSDSDIFCVFVAFVLAEHDLVACFELW
jgi:hypothetical protein